MYLQTTYVANHSFWFRIELINGADRKVLAPVEEGQEWVTNEAFYSQVSSVAKSRVRFSASFI